MNNVILTTLTLGDKEQKISEQLELRADFVSVLVFVFTTLTSQHGFQGYFHWFRWMDKFTWNATY